MITVVLATGVSSSAGVVVGSAIPISIDAIGISITGVAYALASRRFRAISPTINTRAAKNIRVGTAARNDSASAVESIEISPGIRSNCGSVRHSTSDMLTI